MDEGVHHHWPNQTLLPQVVDRCEESRHPHGLIHRGEDSPRCERHTAQPLLQKGGEHQNYVGEVEPIPLPAPHGIESWRVTKGKVSASHIRPYLDPGTSHHGEGTAKE